MNIIALIVAIVAFLCCLRAAFAEYPRTDPPHKTWPGWFPFGVALFIVAVILQLVFMPHSLIQYQPA